MQQIKTIWNRKIPVSNDIYQHFKGHVYSIIGTGIHTETKEPLVAYYNAVGNAWARPLDMFLSPVDIAKYPDAPQENRFENVTNLEILPMIELKPVNCHKADFESIQKLCERDLPMIGEVYHHFKGGYITILAIATHTETEEPVVVYSKQGEIWIRPLEIFLSKVDTQKYPNATQTYKLEKVY